MNEFTPSNTLAWCAASGGAPRGGGVGAVKVVGEGLFLMSEVPLPCTQVVHSGEGPVGAVVWKGPTHHQVSTINLASQSIYR